MSSNNSHVHILVVEDSPTQAQQLCAMLEDHQYAVSAARNGREALNLMAGAAPTLVISDVMMPEMNGYQLCRQIKNDAALKGTPVILLTSLSDPVDVVRGLECGADNFLVKPYDEQVLLSRIAYVLANRHLHDTPKGVEMFFAGQQYLITSDRLQILNLLLSTYETAVQRNRELLKAKSELKIMAESLEDQVRERTTQLQAEVVERERAEHEVRLLNAELEKRVEQRTAELAAANKELESFSYSVSHDLRSPLSTISGYGQMLLEASSPPWPDSEQRKLQTILDSAQHMQDLIEDLINLSRVRAHKIQHRRVNLSPLAEDILKRLAQAQPERRVEWSVAPDLSVEGDSNLLGIAMTNLLSNAWKFTRNSPQARIEVGSQQDGNRTVLFVRDNGAGFDMAYASQLFQTFHRLHAQSEFEGTGIGLATVQRVIQRHDGSIWAEGKVGEGATFYFTLHA